MIDDRTAQIIISPRTREQMEKVLDYDVPGET